MNVGLPGLGLSGVFALLSSLVLPLTRRRHRHRRREALVFTAMGAVITASAAGAWELLWAGIKATTSHGRLRTVTSGLFGPVPVIVVSLAILTAIVLTAEVLSLVLTARETPTPPPVPEVTN